MGYQRATELGPGGSSKCPHCGNSLQNGVPHGSPELRRCATCKHIFVAHPKCRLNQENQEK